MENKSLTVINQQQVLGKEFKIYGDIENPLFLAKDVAQWIEHSNPRVMLNAVDESEKVVNNVYTLGGTQESWFLTEDGLYEVLMQSRKPIAKAFKKEVKVILKQIRQTGGYIHTEENDTDEDIMAKALIIAQKTIERKSQRIKELEVKVEEDKPKVEYYNEVLHSDKLMPVTLIAKDLGMSAIKLNKILNELDIQYKVRNSWVLTAKYQHFVPELADYIINDYSQSLQWTEKGREWIITKVKEYLKK